MFVDAERGREAANVCHNSGLSASDPIVDRMFIPQGALKYHFVLSPSAPPVMRLRATSPQTCDGLCFRAQFPGHDKSAATHAGLIVQALRWWQADACTLREHAAYAYEIISIRLSPLDSLLATSLVQDAGVVVSPACEKEKTIF